MSILKDADKPCPVCGCTNSRVHNDSNKLPAGSILAGKYIVGSVLGQGGFGITYMGFNLNLEQRVAIKEYFPEGYSGRDSISRSTVLPFAGEKGTFFQNGKEHFIGEAKTLARFASVPGIVTVHDFFNENNTAYIVMEFVSGKTVKQLAKEKNGRLSSRQVLKWMEPILDALFTVHQAGLLHRDISPDNIIVTPNGNAVLLDFGAARQISVQGEHSNTINVKHGFAPEEQYRTRGNQGPWSDIYALCATMYYLTTGKVPPQAMDRMMGDAQLLPPNQLGADWLPSQEQAILRGLSVKGTERQQSISELRSELRVSQNDIALAEKKAKEEAERQERERIARERAEQKRIEEEQKAAEKARLAEERERQARERAEQKRIEEEQKAAEKARLAEERERQARERAEQKRIEEEQKAAEKARLAEERERQARERAEQKRIEEKQKAAEKARLAEERERQARERAEQKRIEEEKKAAERAKLVEERERLMKARAEQKRIEAENKAAEQARIAAEQKRIAQERAEQKRIEEERKAEAREKIAKERAEQKRIRIEQQERQAREYAEKKRIENDKKAFERAQIKKQRAEKKQAEAVEKARLVKIKAEQKRIQLERKAAERTRLDQKRAERKIIEEEQKALERARRNEEYARLAEEHARKKQELLEKKAIEQSRLAKEKAEEKRIRFEEKRKQRARRALEYERIAREKAEQKRIDDEKKAVAREELAKERAEQRSIEAEKRANERARLAIERERLANERARLDIERVHLAEERTRKKQELQELKTGNKGSLTRESSEKEPTLLVKKSIKKPDQKKKASSNKIIKIAIAATLGVALLAGGIILLPKYIKTGDGTPNSVNEINGAVGIIEEQQGIQVGDVIKLGKYEQDDNAENGPEDIEWVVIGKKDDKAFVISKYVLDFQRYSEANGRSIWETSGIRTWLNSDFLNTAFSSEEQKIIQTSEVKADANPEKDEDQGSDTTDKVFLLSINEVNDYLSDKEYVVASQTPYVNSLKKKNVAHYEYLKDNDFLPSSWVLRTAGYGAQRTSTVEMDEIELSNEDSYAKNSYGIRPAMWISVADWDLGSIQKADSIQSAEYEVAVFGNYEQDGNVANGKESIEWLVLDEKDDSVLLISRYALDQSLFDGRIRFDVGYDEKNWQTSTIKNWLNSTFLAEAFTNNEQKSILEETEGEKVSLLNVEQAQQYFASNSDRRCKATQYASDKGVKVTNEGYCSWWLKSFDRTMSSNAVLSTGLADPRVMLNNGRNTVAVRPVVWVKKTAITIQEVVEKTLHVGDTLTFGEYEQDADTNNGAENIEWIILEINDNKALLISKYILDGKPYQKQLSDNSNNTWNTCSLRTWLNRDFYNLAFDSDEQSAIVTTRVEPDTNPKFEADQGKATDDRVFALSVVEAEKYITKGITYAQAEGSPYAKEQGAYMSANGCGSWWLRTTGQWNYYGTTVSPNGKVQMQGNDKRGSGADDNPNSTGVRPVIWIDLSSINMPQETASATVTQKEAVSELLVGDTFIFGRYEQDADMDNGPEGIEWVVINKQDNNLFVMSNYTLDFQKFNDGTTDTTWETCTLRKWLNNEFLNTAFSPDEQVVIQDGFASADKNPDTDAYQGNDATDKVFIPSVKEVQDYLWNEEFFVTRPSKYVQKLYPGRYHYNSEEEVPATWVRTSDGTYAEKKGDLSIWTLRTMGAGNLRVAVVKCDSVDTAWDVASANASWEIRPCMWLDASKIDLSTLPVDRPKQVNSKEHKTAVYGKYEQDNVIENGKEDIEWLILDEDDTSYLLLSKYALDYQIYNTDISQGGTNKWKPSKLRKWLNSKFISESFSTEEQSHIRDEYVLEDKVFTLSIDQVIEYFACDKDRKCQATQYVLAQSGNTIKDGYCCWWLRNDDNKYFSPRVCANGLVYDEWVYTPTEYGVRPAIWVDKSVIK